MRSVMSKCFFFLLIFSPVPNNVRTSGPIGMGGTLIDVFRPWEDNGAC